VCDRLIEMGGFCFIEFHIIAATLLVTESIPIQLGRKASEQKDPITTVALRDTLLHSQVVELLFGSHLDLEIL
jgi:hypothetical protein